MDLLGVLTACALAALVVLAGILAFRVSNPPPQAPDPEISDDVVRLLAATRSASVILDAEDRVVRATPAAYALSVVRADRLAHDDLRALATEVRNEGGSREVHLTVPRDPTGPRLSLRVHLVALAGRRVLVLAEDRTQELRLDEVRRDFVANVSHELKTPVGAIALLAETTAEAADDADAVREFTHRLGVESQRLADLVQDIIDLSRLQDSAALRSRARAAVADIVSEAVARCEVEATARGITVLTHVVGTPTVIGDADLLVTAVRNLVDNALRYSDGGTRVTVVARESTAGPPWVEISVIDQGIGMDQAVLPRVFERFYRADPARSRQTGGTGLGLSIVKHIAADHGGDVNVWSELGRGSTFTLRLPLAAPVPAPAPTSPASGASASAFAGNPTPGESRDYHPSR